MFVLHEFVAHIAGNLIRWFESEYSRHSLVLTWLLQA